jgi:hypothetical protein
MKVIKKVDVSDWTYKHTCSGCDSELEVEAKDICHQHYDGDVREPGYDKYSANCVVCSCSISIPAIKIPKLLQVEIQNRTKRSSSNYFDR